MTKKLNARRIKAVRVADAVNRVEGVPVTANARRLSSQWARGEITGEAMKTALIARHRQAPKGYST